MNSSWFCLGQLFASVALNRLAKIDPLDFRTPIYTQVCHFYLLSGSKHAKPTNPCHVQWAMVGVIGIVFAVIPESPWWLASKGKLDKAAKVLHRINGSVENYDVAEQVVSSLFPLSSDHTSHGHSSMTDMINRKS